MGTSVKSAIPPIECQPWCADGSGHTEAHTLEKQCCPGVEHRVAHALHEQISYGKGMPRGREGAGWPDDYLAVDGTKEFSPSRHVQLQVPAGPFQGVRSLPRGVR